MTALVLGGSTEGYELAERCPDAILSLAGRVAKPRTIEGRTRIGGFGGVDGLVEALAGFEAVVDATHPFAARMGANAAEACARTRTPLLRLERPGWQERSGDRWTRVADMPAAAAAIAKGSRVLLAIGRQELDAFTSIDHAWFLVRSIDAPTGPLPPRHAIQTARGPFTVADERTLLREHRIDVIVTRDSGGSTAKLTAARDVGAEVVLVQRPPRPAVPTVATVDAALAWLRAPAAAPPAPRPGGSST